MPCNVNHDTMKTGFLKTCFMHNICLIKLNHSSVCRQKYFHCFCYLFHSLNYNFQHCEDYLVRLYMLPDSKECQKYCQQPSECEDCVEGVGKRVFMSRGFNKRKRPLANQRFSRSPVHPPFIRYSQTSKKQKWCHGY